MGVIQTPDELLTQLIAISRRYGADPAFVLAGGGNTSFKNGDRLWVKASGHTLATISADGFVELDRAKLNAMLRSTWPVDPKAREAAFVEAVMAARVHPGLGQRPSVEALLHHLLPSRFVVHTHPGAVNALTCCMRGREITNELFGDQVLWQAYVDPGLILAKELETAVNQHVGRHVRYPAAIFLANHGLIVGGETIEEIEQETAQLVLALNDRLKQAGPTATAPSHRDPVQLLETYASAFAAQHPKLSAVIDASPNAHLLASVKGYRGAAIAGPLTPDQIVYCRSVPLLFDEPSREISTAVAQWRTTWDAYVTAYGWEPWIAVVAGAGIIAFRNTPALAEISRALFADAAGVYIDATRLGGVRVMDTAQRRFIEEWEVEAYRRSVASGKQ